MSFEDYLDVLAGFETPAVARNRAARPSETGERSTPVWTSETPVSDPKPETRVRVFTLKVDGKEHFRHGSWLGVLQVMEQVGPGEYEVTEYFDHLKCLNCDNGVTRFGGKVKHVASIDNRVCGTPALLPIREG